MQIGFPQIDYAHYYDAANQTWRKKNTQRDAAMAAANAEVDMQQQQDLTNAAAQRSARWNEAALLKGRRKAGGSTYRRRGTVFSGASALDKSNLSALADARRKKATADVNLNYADQAIENPYALKSVSSLGFFAF